MALAHVHFFAKSIGKQVAMNVLLPENITGPLPVYYLLHGLSDDYSIWLRRTRIEMYVAGQPLIVVMPDGYRGFYTDHEDGPAFGKYIAEDVVDFVDSVFPTRKDRSGRAIGGLSMGGYGALRTALAYPDRFASANSHSGAVLCGTQRWDKPHDRLNVRELQHIFGKRPEGSKHDLLTLARSVPKKKLPKLLIDCGTDDFLINDNREFHSKLDALRIPHQYAEHPGSHHWDYWDQHVQEALAFHASVLGI